MHTNPQRKGQTFSFWEEEENLVFLITFERDIGFQQMRCHSTRKNKTSSPPYPAAPIFEIFTFTLSPSFLLSKSIFRKSWYAIFLVFAIPSVTHNPSLRSDHNVRFSILRLYIVVVFARSLARFATTCTAAHSDKGSTLFPKKHSGWKKKQHKY